MHSARKAVYGDAVSDLEAPAAAFNPFGGPSVEDPGPVFEQARREEPVFYSPVIGSWVVTRYDDVAAVLRDPDRFSSREILSIRDLLSPEVAARFGDEVPMEGTLIGLDPPVHTRLRRVMQDAFSPRRVAGMAPGIRELAESLVDAMVAGGDGQADLLASFAFPLPLTVVLRLIGIPDERLEWCAQTCRDWNDLSVALLQGVALEEQLRMADTVLEFHRYVVALIAEREQQPADDLVSALVAVRREEQLTDHELLSLLPGLVFAGHETTANLIGNALAQLLGPGGQWRALCEGSVPAATLVDEALRHDGPVVGLPRVVTGDTELGGVQLHAGDRLYVAYWSANRDEQRYAEPARFDPQRSGPPHLAFGRGIHYCIGASLARLEATVALETLSRRLPGLRLDHEGPPAHLPHFFLRGYERLPVRW